MSEPTNDNDLWMEIPVEEAWILLIDAMEDLRHRKKTRTLSQRENALLNRFDTLLARIIVSVETTAE